jgi:predicted Zn-dependent protease
MRDSFALRSRAARRAMRPRADGLEDRKLLYATLGGHFAFGSRITYSFVPDGTNIGGAPSALYSSMAAKGITTAQWQGAIEQAAAAWEAASNVNLVLVPDDGSAFGASGNQQGDSRFGDIRIGGASLGVGTLATCFLPPAFNGGTLGGDIVLNDNALWGINTNYDIQTVAIHELGHALGLDHSTISTADMYATYNAQKQSLTADDISGVQAVYGARQPDAYDAGAGNNTSANAADITPLINPAGQASIPGLNLTNNDLDWFVVTAPANTSGTITVTMQSTNLSELSPKVLLFDGTLHGIAMASASTGIGATVTVSASGIQPGQKFYIRTQAGAGGNLATGGYGLQVNFGGGTMNPVTPPNTYVASVPDQGGGSASDSLTIARRPAQPVHYALPSGGTPGGPVGLTGPHSPRRGHGGRPRAQADAGQTRWIRAKS